MSEQEVAAAINAKVKDLNDLLIQAARQHIRVDIQVTQPRLTSMRLVSVSGIYKRIEGTDGE